MPATAAQPKTKILRHSALVRVTHWLTFVSFVLLLLTGLEIVVSHPRFYWGETGNVNMKPLFVIPIPASRGTVPTGYSYQMPDQNGWSRYLHFEMAWVLVLTGLLYVAVSLLNGHFRKDILPEPGQRSLGAIFNRLKAYLHRSQPNPAEARSYNVLQRWAYIAVLFILFPLILWTGLALSPSFNAAFPWAVNILGGRQSARTLHFFTTWAIVLFVLIHVTMVALSGFLSRTAPMITGRVYVPASDTPDPEEEVR
jgi:thiosulfate reductase cytochrome b subunit